jgi:hypothetical protein
VKDIHCGCILVFVIESEVMFQWLYRRSNTVVPIFVSAYLCYDSLSIADIHHRVGFVVNGVIDRSSIKSARAIL